LEVLVELRHLRYFVAVAESLHFGRAAAQLRIAQPSLSHQIRQLEAELQTTLFQRTKRRVQLTESGELFLKEAREILAHADRATLIARRVSLGGSERLRVGVAIWTDLRQIFAVVKRLDESHPTIRVDLRSMSVPLQIAALKAGLIDIGFIRAASLEPVLNSELLVAEPFVVALPKNHRLAPRERIALSALAKEPFIMGPHDSMPVFYDLTLKLCRDAGFVPRVRDEVDYPSMVLGFVATGIGIALVPASIRMIQSTGVVFRSLDPSPPILETSVAWRRDNMSQSLNAFLQLVRGVMTSRKSAGAKSS
jgi:DNA-binding transcriptional LysR family regulator